MKLIGLLIIIGCIFEAKLQAKTKLRFCANARESFYVLNVPGTENEPYPGLFIEIIRKVEKKFDLEVEIERYPFQRCLRHLGEGIADAVAGLSYSVEREKNFAQFPPKSEDGLPKSDYSINDAGYILYSAQDKNIDWKGNLKDLSPYTIGSMNSYSILQELREAGIKVDESRNFATLIRKLEANRIDAIALHQSTVDGTPDIKLKRYDPPLSERHYFLVFSKQFYEHHQDLANQIWEFLHQVRKSGKLESITNRYQNLDSFPSGSKK